MTDAHGYFLETYTDRERLVMQHNQFLPIILDLFEHALDGGNIQTTEPWHALDVGCGEGIYANDVVTRWPTAKVVGFDTDAEAIMTGQIVWDVSAERIQLVEHNALVDLPQKYIPKGGFDLAYAILVLCQTTSAQTALQTINRALKPGGLLVTFDMRAPHVFSFPASPALEQLRDFAETLLQRRCSPDYGPNPQPYLEAAGFELVDLTNYKLPTGGETPEGRALLENIRQFVRSVRTGAIASGLASADDYDALLARADAEMLQSRQTGESRTVSVIARKTRDV